MMQQNHYPYFLFFISDKCSVTVYIWEYSSSAGFESSSTVSERGWVIIANGSSSEVFLFSDRGYVHPEYCLKTEISIPLSNQGRARIKMSVMLQRDYMLKQWKKKPMRTYQQHCHKKTFELVFLLMANNIEPHIRYAFC